MFGMSHGIVAQPPQRRRGDRHFADAAELHLVHHLREHAGLGLLVRDHDDRVLGPLDVQALDHGRDLAHVDLALVHPDLAVRADRDQDVAGLLVLGRERLARV